MENNVRKLVVAIRDTCKVCKWPFHRSFSLGWSKMGTPGVTFLLAYSSYTWWASFWYLHTWICLGHFHPSVVLPCPLPLPLFLSSSQSVPFYFDVFHVCMIQRIYIDVYNFIRAWVRDWLQEQGQFPEAKDWRNCPFASLVTAWKSSGVSGTSGALPIAVVNCL